jgi:hypothetical protein
MQVNQDLDDISGLLGVIKMKGLSDAAKISSIWNNCSPPYLGRRLLPGPENGGHLVHVVFYVWARHHSFHRCCYTLCIQAEHISSVHYFATQDGSINARVILSI